MQRYLYLVLMFLFMGVVQMNAQQMVVHMSNGAETNYKESDYDSCKITFSDGQLHFHVGNVVKSSIDIKSVQRISFYGSQSGLDVVDRGSLVSYSSGSETLVVNANPGSLVAVYHTNGARVLSHVQTVASSAVCVSHLPAGTYVVVIGGETFKFVKR